MRYIVRAGCPWRMLPHDLPPWHAVFQQARRWMLAGCFEAMGHDPRMTLRVLGGKAAHPTAVVLDGRNLQSLCGRRPARRLRRLQAAQMPAKACFEIVGEGGLCEINGDETASWL